MNSQICTFENPEFGQIRTVVIDGEPWAVGKDVASALGYKNPSKAVIDHVDEDDKTIIRDSQNGNLEIKTAIINESGIYSLILSSKLESAKRFKHWVTSEVLPQLRRDGVYVTDNLLNNPELAIKAFQRILDLQNELKSRNAENEQLTERVEKLQPKADYFDQVANAEGLTSFRETAKLFGIPEKQFTKCLVAHDYCYRDSKNRLMPYAGKLRSGLFEVKEATYGGLSGTHTTVYTKITPKGRTVIWRAIRDEFFGEEA